ncbi:MAG: AAA family ATPase [Halodesulfurarchaeum sp.]
MSETPDSDAVSGSSVPTGPTADVRPLPSDEATDLIHDVIENVESVIVGNTDGIEHVLTAVLGRGHVLLEDVPGVGKTKLARSIARSIAGEFRRIQFTPDLLPTDVTGVNVFNEKTREFDFRPGPVFGNVVLADEIDRAPPKTQSALLEAMEERQVTTDGETRALPDPFVVIATQNTIERERTYDLPVAELDRFTKRVSLGYPDADEEKVILERTVGGDPLDAIDAVTTVEQVRRARATAAAITVSDPIRDYVTRLSRFTRDRAALGASPRASIALLRACQGRAVLAGRDYVIPDDVKAEAVPVLAHRIRAGSSDAVGSPSSRELVETALERVPPE